MEKSDKSDNSDNSDNLDNSDKSDNSDNSDTSDSSFELFVNLKSVNVKHIWPTVDRCCKRPPNDFGFENIDQISRIGCDVDKDEFFENFVQKRKAVMLLGCSDDWKAKDWTIKGKF